MSSTQLMDATNNEDSKSHDRRVSDLYERVLLISVEADQVGKERIPSVPPCTIFMLEYSNEDNLVKTEDLESMVFDRLMLTDHEDRTQVRHMGRDINTMSSYEKPQHHPFHYLHNCYERIISEKNQMSEYAELDILKGLVLQNMQTMLASPMMFEGVYSEMKVKNTHQKLFELTDQAYDIKQGTTLFGIFSDMAQLAGNKEDALAMFAPFFAEQVNFFKQIEVEDFAFYRQVNVLITLASIPHISGAILLHRNNLDGIMEQLKPDSLKCILAIMLEKSCMVTVPIKRGDHPKYFDPTTGGHHRDEDTIHGHMIKLHQHMKDLFMKFLRCKGDSKKLLLKWIGQLMNEHAYCAKLWTHEQMNHELSVFSTDAIFMSLASVLVQLSLPFCTNKMGVSNEKWLKIDPTFCVASGCDDHVERGVHVTGLHTETCIVNLSKEDQEKSEKLEASTSYNFISECFFLAHRALYLGMHGLLVKFYRLNKDLARMKDVYRDAVDGNLPMNQADKIKARFTSAYSVFMTTKATLSDPEFISNCTLFQLTTCRFLNQMSYTMDRSKVAQIPLPLVTESPPTLNVLPEFIVENLVDFLLFLKRFEPNKLDDFVTNSNYLLVLINIFMGNHSRMTNPHLRAALADVLEAILPIREDDDDTSQFDDNYVTINAVKNFDNVKDLYQSVLQLYSDIEFTGDPHSFEQKFNYRRPLYSIMKFLWADSRGKAAVKELSLKSVEDIDAAKPPLMLSFINLFLNDAVFMLDEAIENLTKIKIDQAAKNNREWEKLNEKDRAEKEKLLKQMIQYCRFHNYMSNKTVETLAYMSTQQEVKDLLCHNVLVNRIANMLNNFLDRLTGKKMSDLKVDDLAELEFKPKELVHNICSIYANLGGKDEFCKAVSQDGRSFTPQLFPNAIRILGKINSTDLIPAIQNINQRASEFTALEAEDDLLFEDAPDEFMDPIMGCVMKDPVILPSSNITVDRSTISRHLLSDHTDPFNRNPLTMEDVIPNTELSNKLKQWLADKKKSMQQS